ncbi:MAG: hypothetical protein IJS01_12195 [Lentisphaeria bacterium]|nr:hypothetical protein [Lentisphaeria bacterium]
MSEQEAKSRQSSDQPQKVEENEVFSLIAALKFVESFLTNIIWGILIKCLFIRIPKFIYDVCKTILTFVFNLLKDFLRWVTRNFGKIIEVFYRTAKIVFLLIFLAFLAFWPFFIGQLWGLAWIFVVVLPGVGWGIIRWRRQQREKLKTGEPRASQKEESRENNPEQPSSPDKEQTKD